MRGAQLFLQLCQPLLLPVTKRQDSSSLALTHRHHQDEVGQPIKVILEPLHSELQITIESLRSFKLAISKKVGAVAGYNERCFDICHLSTLLEATVRVKGSGGAS